MTRLVLASLRHRRHAFLASFLSVFLGSSIVMAFASMLDTASQSGVSNSDRTTLTIVASVVGGWGAIIVACAVAMTLVVAAQQRAAELSLLRCVGASPDQVVALIMRETWVVAIVAALLALPAGYGGGHLLLAMLQQSGQVAPQIGYRFGPAALGIGLGVGVAVSMIATRVTARRVASRPVREALFEASAGARGMSRRRFWIGVVLVGFGLESVVLSLTVVGGKTVYVVQPIAVEACIWSGIGFALLAPVLLRGAIAVLDAALRAVAGTAGELAVAGMRRRIQQAATPLMPIIVVTSIATGTLYMQAITNSLHPMADKSVEMVNYVIVAMISVFAAVMLMNLLFVTLADRCREFAQQRLVGATPRQLFGLVTAETGLLLLVGLTFGTIGALLTIVPFSIKTAHRAVPHAPLWIYLAIVTGVTVLAIGTSLVATRRATRAAAVIVLHEAAHT